MSSEVTPTQSLLNRLLARVCRAVERLGDELQVIFLGRMPDFEGIAAPDLTPWLSRSASSQSALLSTEVMFVSVVMRIQSLGTIAGRPGGWINGTAGCSSR